MNSLNSTEPNVIFIDSCIIGSGINETDLDVQYAGCQCTKCNSTTCPCLLRFGVNYNYNRLLKIDDNSPPIFECNSECLCDLQCQNRVIQNNTAFPLMKTWTSHKNWGVITCEDIPSWHFVCEYVGEIISPEVALKRNSQYTLTVIEHWQNKANKTFIDAYQYGNIARYINHSCEPNLKLFPVRINNIIPHLCFFSTKNICKMEELTFHYGQHINMPVRNTDNRSPCFCGSVHCQKYLPYDELAF